jgi:hypothetical protein
MSCAAAFVIVHGAGKRTIVRRKLHFGSYRSRRPGPMTHQMQSKTHQASGACAQGMSGRPRELGKSSFRQSMRGKDSGEACRKLKKNRNQNWREACGAAFSRLALQKGAQGPNPPAWRSFARTLRFGGPIRTAKNRMQFRLEYASITFSSMRVGNLITRVNKITFSRNKDCHDGVCDT